MGPRNYVTVLIFKEIFLLYNKMFRFVKDGVKHVINLKNVNMVSLHKNTITFTFTNTEHGGFLVAGSGFMLSNKNKYFLKFDDDILAEKEFERITQYIS